MPPSDSAYYSLTAAQKSTLERWIAEGAKYDEHWAYKPLVRPAVHELAIGTAYRDHLKPELAARLTELYREVYALRQCAEHAALVSNDGAPRREFRIDFDARELAIVANVMITGMTAERTEQESHEEHRRQFSSHPDSVKFHPAVTTKYSVNSK